MHKSAGRDQQNIFDTSYSHPVQLILEFDQKKMQAEKAGPVWTAKTETKRRYEDLCFCEWGHEDDIIRYRITNRLLIKNILKHCNAQMQFHECMWKIALLWKMLYTFCTIIYMMI